MSRDAADLTGSEVTAGEAVPIREVAVGLLAAMRPRQWVKNLLVFAAPVAAGVIARPAPMRQTAMALVAFVMASSGTYLLNDVLDRQVDASHPVKRTRPIASGLVPVPLAVGASVLLLVGGIVVGALTGTWGLPAIIAAYVIASTGYSFGLKRQALVELFIVASGFLFRALAGAVAAQVPISQWFLIVISFGAIYLVATKRYAELRDQEGSDTRLVLGGYSADVLREIRFTSAAVTIAGYVLWAFENARVSGVSWWFELSIVPFVLAIYRYALAVHEGQGEAPEVILLEDRQIRVVGLLWVVLYGVGIYVV